MRNDWIFKMFPYFFVTVFVLIVAYYILLGTVAVKAVSAVEEECKDGFAKCLGRQVKQFNEGMEGK